MEGDIFIASGESGPGDSSVVVWRQSKPSAVDGRAKSPRLNDRGEFQLVISGRWLIIFAAAVAAFAVLSQLQVVDSSKNGLRFFQEALYRSMIEVRERCFWQNKAF